MEYFDYKTRNRESGKTCKGIITSDDIESASDTLKRRGEDIIELDYMSDVLGIRKIIYDISTRTGKKVKLEFLAMLKFMLESGISLHEAVKNIRDTSNNKSLKNLTRVIADEVRKGASLSTALKKSDQFDEAVVQQLKAGEESGSITGALTRLIKQMEQEMEFKSKIKSAMIYPIIICIVMVAVLWVMMTMVVPTLAETLISMGGDLPLITKIVIGISTGMKVATPYIITGIIAGIIAYRVAMKNPYFRLSVDTYKLKIPIIGNMLEKIELGRFARNLSAMQRSGISLVSSLSIVRDAIKNQAIAKKIEKARRIVEKSGMNLSVALLRAGSFPQMMLQLIEIGINSGQICEVLDRISEQYEKEVDSSLKRITSMIEPILIVFCGLGAGVVVISIMLPMFSMTDQMSV